MTHTRFYSNLGILPKNDQRDWGAALRKIAEALGIDVAIVDIQECQEVCNDTRNELAGKADKLSILSHGLSVYLARKLSREGKRHGAVYWHGRFYCQIIDATPVTLIFVVRSLLREVELPRDVYGNAHSRMIWKQADSFSVY